MIGCVQLSDVSVIRMILSYGTPTNWGWAFLYGEVQHREKTELILTVKNGN